MFINQAVCEGCGDCSVQSNCLSVTPVETEFGRKRAIDQSSCNKDFSCLNGFCPSFVTVEGGGVRKGKADKKAGRGRRPNRRCRPRPSCRSVADKPYGVLITGIGGTGVVTIGAIMGMAAHIEGKGATVLDQLGMAQKGGAVISHVRIGASPEALHAVRLGAGGADLLLGCDLVVSASADALARLEPGASRAIVNTHETITGDFTRQPDLAFPAQHAAALGRGGGRRRGLRLRRGDRDRHGAAGRFHRHQHVHAGLRLSEGPDPDRPRSARTGDRAERRGRGDEHRGLPLGPSRRPRPRRRREAFGAGRERRAVPHLADRGRDRGVARQASDRLPERSPRRALQGPGRQGAGGRAEDAGKSGLAEAVARNYAKLLAYKDEYEVARLYADAAFQAGLERQFEGDYKLKFHLAPPLFASRDPKTGHLLKQEFGSWMLPAFKLLAKFKFLRGTAFDPFGYTAERKVERALIGEYEGLVGELLATLTATNHDLAVHLASVPDDIKGYGHVKDAHLAKARRKQGELLQQWRNQVAAKIAAE